MNEPDVKRVIYVAPDGETYQFATPSAKNRLDAVTQFISALEADGLNPKEYHILRTDGFSPSKTEVVIKSHIDRFGGGE